MAQINVGVAECAVSAASDTVLATFALGSCIALTLWDPERRVGGMLHFLLPESALDTDRARRNPFVCADTGVPALVRRCTRLGADPRRLVARAAGGAQVLDCTGFLDVSARNHATLRNVLRSAGLSLACSAIGGTVSRSLRLDVGTGRCWVGEGVAAVELPLPAEWRRD
jgi:chemotaxis protein CheD